MRKEEGGPAPSGERERWAELLEASKALRDCGCFGDREWDRAVERMDDAIEACEDEAEGPTAQPSPLTWSREKPKVEGWYWCRNPMYPKTASIDEIRIDDNGVVLWAQELHDVVEWEPVSDKVEWAGPIPEPTPPEGGSQRWRRPCSKSYALGCPAFWLRWSYPKGKVLIFFAW